jgi:hypothetical protein
MTMIRYCRKQHDIALGCAYANKTLLLGELANVLMMCLELYGHMDSQLLSVSDQALTAKQSGDANLTSHPITRVRESDKKVRLNHIPLPYMIRRGYYLVNCSLYQSTVVSCL